MDRREVIALPVKGLQSVRVEAMPGPDGSPQSILSMLRGLTFNQNDLMANFPVVVVATEHAGRELRCNAIVSLLGLPRFVRTDDGWAVELGVDEDAVLYEAEDGHPLEIKWGTPNNAFCPCCLPIRLSGVLNNREPGSLVMSARKQPGDYWVFFFRHPERLAA